MPGGDVETRLKHEFHLLRGTTAAFAVLTLWSGYVCLTAPAEKPVSPLIPLASLATTALLARRYQVDSCAMPLVLQEWQRLGPQELRKFIAHQQCQP
jgi:hypothetical protein